MEMIEMTANSRYVGKVRVFLNGEDVTNQTRWARVPAEAGVEGNGEIEVWREPKKLGTERKSGRVYWVHKASTM